VLTAHIIYIFSKKGFVVGSTRPTSSSKYPKS